MKSLAIWMTDVARRDRRLFGAGVALAVLFHLSPSLLARQAGVMDARAEVAAVLYAASVTQEAALRAADAKVRALRSQIERLQAEGRQRAAELTDAQEQFVSALATRDRAYAEEIAVFRKAVQDIVTTPEGVVALARYNAGDEVGALSILDKLRAGRDAARRRRATLESAAEGRRIATLALDARAKGKISTAQVIARFEEVTRLDPGVHWDWVELARLHKDAGSLAAAHHATADGRRYLQGRP